MNTSDSKKEWAERYPPESLKARIGEYAEQLFFLVIKNQPRDWSRTVKGIVSLKKSYPEKVINLACRRALAYDVYQYSIIKNICHNGSYNMPVEFNVSLEGEYL